MTKRKIQIIIAAMSIALVALVAFQLYWIGFTVRAKNEQFGSDVRDAMQEVARNLEKQEIIYLTQQKVAAQQHQERLASLAKKAPKKKRIIHPEDTPIASRTNPLVGLQPQTVGDAIQDFTIANPDMPVIEEFHYEININDMSKRLEAEKEFNEIVSQVFGKQMAILRQQDSLQQAYYERLQQKNTPKDKPTNRSIAKRFYDEKLKQAEGKSALVKDVFDEFFFKERKIADRINRQVLDSLLKEFIQAKGIDIPFEYGVVVKENPNTMQFSNVTFTKEPTVLQQGYRTNLFASDIQGANAFLTVFFPQKDSFIIKNIWWMYVCSLLLLVTFIGLFYVAVSTILQQKKLADIKNDFINNMTHEFKTPISTISLACEVLQDGSVSASPSMFQRYLGIIRDENRRLGTQVEKVLQTALLDKGEVKLKLGMVNVHEVIEKVLANLSPQIEMKHGSVSLDLQAHSPEIEADEVHLTNIIFNLLDNANKYSPEKPEISIETHNDENNLIVKVIDKGIGIEKEAMKNIFEKFYRVPTGNLHDVKGFGLGLSYVKKMVEEHHGTVSVQSVAGTGSVFEVGLPLVP